jgi:hypothetical protein
LTALLRLLEAPDLAAPVDTVWRPPSSKAAIEKRARKQVRICILLW